MEGTPAASSRCADDVGKELFPGRSGSTLLFDASSSERREDVSACGCQVIREPAYRQQPATASSMTATNNATGFHTLSTGMKYILGQSHPQRREGGWGDGQSGVWELVVSRRRQLGGTHP